MAKKEKRFTAIDYLVRFGLALLLVLATYNPSSWSFIDWVVTSVSDGNLGAEHFLVGVVLVIGWAMLIRATLNSLGSVGLGLGAALIAALVWVLYDIGLLSGSSFTVLSWIALVGLSALLAIGLCWANLWRSLTGQYSIDDVDD